MKEIYQEIWYESLPFQDKREDDGHARTVLHFAKLLLEKVDADSDIVIPAAILHDIGWSQMPKEKAMKFMDPELRLEVQQLHEQLGASLARKILLELNYPEKKIDEICEIIGGHDTREGFLDKNDGIVRDADKLWRFSKLGFWTDVKRRPENGTEWAEKVKIIFLEKDEFFFSDEAREIAEQELKESL